MYWTIHLEGGLRRVNHAAAAIGKSIFTFGGYCSDIDYHVFKPIDIHVLDTEKLKWWKLELNDNQDYNYIPFQRYGHTAVAHGIYIYLWGGRNDLKICNTLYCFNTETLTWSVPNVFGKKPVPRESHSACVIGNFMYIFGGCQDHPFEFSRDLYMLNFNTMVWSRVKTKGTPPPYRDFHSATAIDKKMYVYGGRGDRHAPMPTGKEVYCPKMYYFDTITKIWVCPPSVSGKRPPGRRSHSAFEHNGFLYIFGGYNKNMESHFKDINRYDPNTFKWTLVSAVGISPCARRRQICEKINNRVFISGGTSPNPKSTTPIRVVADDDDDDEQPLDQLIDHDDVHVLDLSPNLKDMCLVNLWKYIIEKKIRVDNNSIPLSLKKDMAATEPLDTSLIFEIPHAH